MRRIGLNLVRTGLILALVSGLSLTALGASEGGSEEEPPPASTTTIDSGLSPAVDVGTDAGDAEPVDWTYRYMIPTALALAGIIVVITSVKYFTDVVRRRYRIVEE